MMRGVRVLVLLGLVAVLLAACGVSEATTPSASVTGPTLIFFYTDP